MRQSDLLKIFKAIFLLSFLFVDFFEFGYTQIANAGVMGISSTGSAGLLTQASPVTTQINNQTYACIADDGKYACSPGVKSDLSDVPNNACSGKQSQPVDKSLCGTIPGATTGPQPCTPSGNSPCTPSGNSPCTPTGNQPCTPSGDLSQTNNSTANCSGNNCVYNPLPTDDLKTVLLLIIKWLLGIIGGASVLFIMIGGFQMVMSQGNEENYTKAKKTLIWAVLGLIIAVLSFSIVAIVQNLLQAKVQ